MNRYLFAATLFLSASAAAQEAPVRYMPEPDFEAVIGRTVDNFKPHDAFQGVAACGVVDAKFMAKVSLEDAQKMLTPCLKAVSAVYNTKVTVKEGTLDAQDGRMNAQVEILFLEVPQGTGATSPIMRDLNRSISLRGGRLLGHQAVVVPAQAHKTPQEALNECVLPMVVREIDNGAAFIKAYGACLKKTPEFQIVEMQPWPNKPMGVILLTKADKPVAESLTTSVKVDSAEGPVTVDLVAYPETIYLP